MVVAGNTEGNFDAWGQDPDDTGSGSGTTRGRDTERGKRNYGPAGDISFRQQGEVGGFYGGYDTRKTIQSRGTGAYSQGTGRRGGTGPSPPVTGNEEEVIFKETPIQVTQQGPNIMDDVPPDSSLNLSTVNTLMTKPSVPNKPDTIVSDDVEDSVNNYVDAQTAGFSSGAGGAVGSISELQNMLTAYQGRGTLIQGRTAQKSVYTIDRFDGGLNTSFNPRDLSYWQACSMDELSPSKIGRLVRLGDFKTSTRSIVSTDSQYQTDNENYGLHYVKFSTNLSADDTLDEGVPSNYFTTIFDTGASTEHITSASDRNMSSSPNWHEYTPKDNSYLQSAATIYNGISMPANGWSAKGNYIHLTAPVIDTDNNSNSQQRADEELYFWGFGIKDANCTDVAADTTYILSADVWSSSGVVEKAIFGVGGTYSDSFPVSTKRTTIKKYIKASSTAFQSKTCVTTINTSSGDGTSDLAPPIVIGMKSGYVSRTLNFTNVSLKIAQSVNVLQESDAEDYQIASAISGFDTGLKPSMFSADNKIFCSDANFSNSSSNSFVTGIIDRPSLIPYDDNGEKRYLIDGSTGSKILKDEPLVPLPPIAGYGDGQIAIRGNAETVLDNGGDDGESGDGISNMVKVLGIPRDSSTLSGIFIGIGFIHGDFTRGSEGGWVQEYGNPKYYKFYASFLFDSASETPLTDVTTTDGSTFGGSQVVKLTLDNNTNAELKGLVLQQVIFDINTFYNKFPRITGARFYYAEVDSSGAPLGDDKYQFAELDFKNGFRCEPAFNNYLLFDAMASDVIKATEASSEGTYETREPNNYNIGEKVHVHGTTNYNSDAMASNPWNERLIEEVEDDASTNEYTFKTDFAATGAADETGLEAKAYLGVQVVGAGTSSLSLAEGSGKQASLKIWSWSRVGDSGTEITFSTIGNHGFEVGDYIDIIRTSHFNSSNLATGKVTYTNGTSQFKMTASSPTDDDDAAYDTSATSITAYAKYSQGDGEILIPDPPKTFTFFYNNLFYEDEIKYDLRWKCSALGNGVAFIGNVKYDGVEYPDVMLYSATGGQTSGQVSPTYSVFPVESNRIHIPGDSGAITAIIWTSNRVLQFRLNALYVINVTNIVEPIIESSYQGMGVHGQHAVTITPFGVAWVNDGGVYSYNIEKKAVRSLTVGRIESEEISSGLVNCSITGYSIASSAKTVTYTCSANHNLSVGEKVSVTGVTGTNGKNDSDFSSPYVSALGGSPNEDTQFTMKLTTAPVSDPSDSGLTGTLKCIGHSDNKIGYDDRSKMLIIGNHLKSNTKGYHYAYSLVSDSWCTWEVNKVSFSPTSNYSIDKDGYLTGFIYADGSNDNISRWSVTPNTAGVVEYITKDIDMGKPSINKRLFTLYISYTGGTGQSNMWIYFRINGMYGSDTDSGWTRLQTIQDYTNPYGSNSGSAWATTGTPTTGDAVIPTADDLDSTDTSDVQKLAKINLRHLVSSDGNHDDTVVNSTLPKDYLKFARSIQFKIAGTASATFEINDITLVYKDKIIK